jgi:hypothetical protein
MDRHSPPRGHREHAPWLRNERWSSGVIRDQSAESLSVVWILAILWNAITALALLPRVKQGIHAHDQLWLLALAFPAIGVGLLIWAVRRTRRITKFGPSAFHLRTLPATPGGELAGTIRVTRKFEPKSGIQLQLACIVRFVTGFGRHARVIDRVVWKEARTLERVAPCNDGMDIPVLFRIPADAEPSSDLEFGDGVRWRLEARCKTAGVAYYSRFDVPVFVVAEPEFTARRREFVTPPARLEPSDPRGKLGERGIVMDRTAGGRLRIQFAAARNKSFIAFTAIIGLALSVMAMAMVNRFGTGTERIMTIGVASMVLFLGGVFVFIALFNWLATEEITVRYGSLTAERRGPLFRQQRTYKLGDVSDIFQKIETGSSSASGGGSAKKKSFHRIMLKTRDGELIWIAKDIVQGDYAAWLADEIKETLGVVAGK